MSNEDEPTPSRHYPREVALQALRRAARLQVEAAEAAERRSTPAVVDDEPDGYAHRELLEAAREAGIDEELVTVALAELEGGEGTTSLALPEREEEQAATRWLGTTQRNVLVSRVIEGEPEKVWPAIGKVFEAESCGLSLQPSGHAHPAQGGVAQFTMKPLGRMMQERGGYSQLCYRMEQLELRRLSVKLRDLGGRTQVTVYGDLRDGVRINLRWARRSAVGLGALVGGGGAAVGLAAGLLAAAATGALGVAVGAAATVGLWRLSYRHALAKMERELEALLGQVAAQLHREAVYRLPAGEG